MPPRARQQRAPIIDAPPELQARLAATERRLAELREMRARRWRYDPVLWARECIDWGPDGGLTEYQEEILAGLVEKSRMCVRGPHGLGKTTTEAIAVLWFATTREMAGIDWKAVTTAGAWRQLEKYLWPEIHKWAGKIRWDVLGLLPFSAQQLLDLSLRLDHGEAFAVASSDPMLIEGAHADAIIYIYDEAKSISAGIYDASEGAFSGSTGTRGQLPEAYGLAQSTPGDPEGRFYEIHKRKPGFEDWGVRHVTLADSMKAGRISQDWADARKRQWGPTSQLYNNRVLGEFKGSEHNSIVPLAWIEAANDRWRAWEDDGRPLGPMTHLGVDVAREGEDQSAFCKRHGIIITEVVRRDWDDTTQTAGEAIALLGVHTEVEAMIDTTGVGAGVFDMVRAQFKSRAHDFKGAEKTHRKDRTGEHEFTNTRSAAWWNLRDMLDPQYSPTLCLPPDEVMTGDLTGPRWKITPTGKIQVEPKDDVKKRLGRSPDAGDAVVMGCWPVERRAKMVFAGRVNQRRDRMVGSVR